MRRIRVLAVVVCVLALIVSPVFAGEVGKMTPAKEAAIKWLDGHAKVGVDVATYIWNNPELGLGEHLDPRLIELLRALFDHLLKVPGVGEELLPGPLAFGDVARHGEDQPLGRQRV